MSRNRTQRYADFLITDAVTMAQEIEGDPKRILNEAIDRDPNHAKGAAVNSIGMKAMELEQDLPPSIDKDKLLEIALDRLEAAESDIREGGYGR